MSRKPQPPIVLGIRFNAKRLRKIVEDDGRKDYEIPSDIAMDILCDYADYGYKMHMRELKAAQKEKAKS